MNHTEKIVTVIVFVFLLGILLIGVPVGLLLSGDLTNDSKASETLMLSTTTSMTSSTNSSLVEQFSNPTNLMDFTTTGSPAENNVTNVTMESIVTPKSNVTTVPSVTTESNVTIEWNKPTEAADPILFDYAATEMVANTSASTSAYTNATNENTTISSYNTTTSATTSRPGLLEPVKTFICNIPIFPFCP